VAFSYRPRPLTFTRSLNLAIPDNNTVGITDATSVSGSGTVSNATVTVNITHTFIGDLTVTLIAPDGTRHALHSQSGSGTDNINQSYDVSTALAGKAIAGSWKLEVRDLASADLGTLNSWGMSFGRPWTTIATDSDGADTSGEWTANWNTTAVANGAGYEVRAVATSTGGTSESIRTSITVSNSGTTTPTLTINDITKVEGQTGTSNAVFTVTLSAVSTQNVTFQFATANGTATAPSDYTARALTTLTIPAGSTRATLSVAVVGDTVAEPDETLFVNLSNASGATIAKTQGRCTITNDDTTVALPQLFISDLVIREGDVGNGAVYFTVRLSRPSTSTVTVNFATADGTATTSAQPANAGTDYTAASGIVTFIAGAITQSVAVVVRGDTTVESNERFFVNLSTPVGATISDALGICTIVNDDVAPGSLALQNNAVDNEAALDVDPVVEVHTSASLITIEFPVALSEQSADRAGNYTVRVNGQEVVAQSAKADAKTGAVMLLLPEGTLTADDEVQVEWRLLSAAGDEVNGSFTSGGR
jgi:subtilisin-like proprotein convertase family protein